MFEPLLASFVEPVTAFLVFMLGAVLIKALRDWLAEQLANKEVREAEHEAFKQEPDKIAARLSELVASESGIDQKVSEVSALVEESKSAISMGRLFNLYSKQIEKYQQETRSRATWSFIFAITAMCAGLGFIGWGGSVLLTATEGIVLAAGGIISTVGGAVSGYIAKTFLDVHKLSLKQLNRYFQQPVLNDHILMAQRLADESDDAETRKRAYEKIIESITTLISRDTTETAEGA